MPEGVRGPLQPHRLRPGFAGLVVAGALLASPSLGQVLSGAYLSSDYLPNAAPFAGAALGFLFGVLVALKWGHWRTAKAIRACCLASAGVWLAAAALQGRDLPWLTPLQMTAAGFFAACLQHSAFRALQPVYRLEPAAAAYLSGTFFNLGCLAICALTAWSVALFNPAAVLMQACVLPVLAVWVAGRSPETSEHVAARTLPLSKQPGFYLFTAMLTVQFANEWTVAGWLPTFVMQRLGLSARAAILFLALFWLVLLLGRVAAHGSLHKVRHSVLLLGAAALSLAGCLFLALTDNRLGLLLGVSFAGCGFALLPALAAHKLGPLDFPQDASALERVFLPALGAGLLGPALAALLAERFGIQAVVLLPAAGSLVTLLLAGTLLITAHFRRPLAKPGARGPAVRGSVDERD